ncbi:hypothetical protein E2C01_060039 [Portunus trituberculatus]|uniref:Uncharacterized protein n=1 Tax=Portunus trituberculatus TaxID=210409 RepID=A0A5B7GZY4_PORTR|nr:hypothetical protein [Portunus trituberculatus]
MLAGQGAPRLAGQVTEHCMARLLQAVHGCVHASHDLGISPSHHYAARTRGASQCFQRNNTAFVSRVNHALYPPFLPTSLPSFLPSFLASSHRLHTSPPSPVASPTSLTLDHDTSMTPPPRHIHPLR